MEKYLFDDNGFVMSWTVMSIITRLLTFHRIICHLTRR